MKTTTTTMMTPNLISNHWSSWKCLPSIWNGECVFAIEHVIASIENRVNTVDSTITAIFLMWFTSRLAHISIVGKRVANICMSSRKLCIVFPLEMWVIIRIESYKSKTNCSVKVTTIFFFFEIVTYTNIWKSHTTTDVMHVEWNKFSNKFHELRSRQQSTIHSQYSSVVGVRSFALKKAFDSIQSSFRFNSHHTNDILC